jgi:hypothetical protein
VDGADLIAGAIFTVLFQPLCPESNRIGQGSTYEENTVGIAVADKQEEELVVPESDAVVNPGAMMVLLEDAGLAH